MKKIIIISISILLGLNLVTGCGCKRKENNKKNPDQNQAVIKDQIFDGLEFVNVGTDSNVIKTVVINNTGVVYEGSKFSMKVMDESGNVLGEATDEVTGSMKTGTTKEIDTKVSFDLSKAVSIEYSIIK